MAKTTKKSAAKKIELRPIRRELLKYTKQAEQTLAKRKASGVKAVKVQGQTELQTALRSMNRMLAEIQSICGSDMSIPIA
jgi:uncharacterized protein with gpF-like domain